MEYREFVCAAIETMNQKEGKNGIQAREHRAVKNNGKIRVGLLLQETGSNLFPTIYLEEYYEKFQKGETLEQIVSEISQLYQKIKAKNIIDVDSFFNLESWKNKLGIKVIKTEKNRELLEEIPHLDVLDLSLTFYVILDRQCEGSATMQITNEYMRQWNLETEELYEMAMRSAVRLLPAEFCSLPDMIRRITGIEVEAIRGMQRECQMYVLTNSSKIQGAACMFYPHVLEMIGEILKEDFYILPSSIHEVIILPKSREIAKGELEATDVDTKPEESLFYKELREQLAAAIDSLGEKERLVISLYYYEELKYSEIAEILGIGQSRVCQIHTKAIGKLKASMEEYMKG